jgi:hypothetical protein
MWFRRRRRHPPPVLLPPLERLAELVDRVVTLLDQAPTPAPEQAVAESEAEPAEEEVREGHVLFVPSSAGYRLLARDGPAPDRVDVVELDEERYRVVRLGRSPLPRDRRRCAFLEQEPPAENRTQTGAGGEPDREHESGAPG